MSTIQVQVDSETKRRMVALRHIDWPGVLRAAILQRLKAEERLHPRVDRRPARQAARRIDEFRSGIRPSEYDAVRAIRKGRDAGRRGWVRPRV